MSEKYNTPFSAPSQLIELTQQLINFPTVSRWSNIALSDHLEEVLKQCAFEVERLTYIDENGEVKVSLVAKKGDGADGLAFFSHSDTVPGQEEDWDAFNATVEHGRVVGRGSCDMKGPLAATVIAAANVDVNRLKRAVYVVVCADEEISGQGAKQVAAESELFKAALPKHGVVAEPTSLVPVYAHKGGALIEVVARGEAAHTSTDKGVSANFLMVPFLADMVELAKQVKSDESFMDSEFGPPTCGFNFVLDDGGCRPNVTAAKTVCRVCFRTMPNARSKDLLTRVTSRAADYGFEVQSQFTEPFHVSPTADIVQIACQITDIEDPKTVPYGTDAFYLSDRFELVVLGPGDIAQAHTVGEWIEIDQLNRAVAVYEQMIHALCM